jgi:serine/threonine protein kinase
VLESVRSGVYEFEDEEWNDISDSAKDLISHMLEKDPSQRWDMETCLSHPWIQNKDENSDNPLALLNLGHLKEKQNAKKLQMSILAVITS